jgi:hypothetical protein
MKNIGSEIYASYNPILEYMYEDIIKKKVVPFMDIWEINEVLLAHRQNSVAVARTIRDEYIRPGEEQTGLPDILWTGQANASRIP